MCSVNAADEEQRWVPTHVQVLVIRARGLRSKGKHGTSDAYTVIQLGKEKYSTCVIEKSTEPEWGEECSFELQPGALEEGGRDMCPPGSCDLTLTVMHRALIGLDVFLGQAVIPLDKAFSERRCMKNAWNKLNSKTGKKEKERGELQVTVQFTRHNLTASMYDLSIKDKPRSAFGKLRERMRAKKRGVDEESSSAIVPGGYGALARMRGRLPSDGGGEEDYEDDEGGELRRSKMRSFFLRGRLRKSSDTRSSTSLGSESSESSSRGGSLSPTAGISVVVSDLSNSPSNSSNLTADNSPEHTVAPSPQVSPVKHVFDDEQCDGSIPVPHSLTNDNEFPILLPSVCVNGNPVETSPLTHQPPTLILQQPKSQPQTQQELTKTAPQKSSPVKKLTETVKLRESKPQQDPQIQLPKIESKPKPEPKVPTLGLLQKGSVLSLSLQNLSRQGEERQGGGPVDGRRWSFDKPGEEEKAAIAAALENAGLITDEPKVEMTMSETQVPQKKKRGLFSHGRGCEAAGKGSGTCKEETGHSQTHTEGKTRGWFSSKDTHSKPSQILAPQGSSTTDPTSPLTSADRSQGTTRHYTNPFASSPLYSPFNPFFSQLQQNPFFQELCTISPLTPSLPSLYIPDYNYDPASVFGEAVSKNGHSGFISIFDALFTKAVNTSEIGVNPTVCQSEKYSAWDNFMSDRLKSLENEPRINNLLPPLIKPTDSTPADADGGLALSNMGDELLSRINPALTFANNLNSSNTLFQPSTNYMCWWTCNTDLNNAANQEALVSDFDLSLPQNSSIEFSELNALVCPYPSISTHSVTLDNFSAASYTESFVVEPLTTSLCRISSSALSISADNSTFSNNSLDSLRLTVDKKANYEMEKYPSSGMLMDDTYKSVETLETSAPCCKHFSSDDSLEPTIITSDSLDYRVSNPSQTRTGNVKLKSTITDEGDIELKESVFSSHAETSDCIFNAGVVTKEKDAEGDPVCMSLDKSGVSLVEEGSLIDEREGLMTSSPGVSVSVPLVKVEISDWTPDPSRNNSRVGLFSGNPDVETPLFSRQTLPEGHLHHRNANVLMETDPNALIPAHSPGSLLFHSLYSTADSEQYVTCRSQQNSFSVDERSQESKPKHDPFQEIEPEVLFFQEAKPNDFSSQWGLPANDICQKNMSEVQCSKVSLDLFEEPENVRDGSQHNLFNLTAGPNFAPKYNPSRNNVKCAQEDVAPGITNEAILKHDPFMEIMLNHDLIQEEKVTPPKVTSRPEVVLKIYPTDPGLSHSVQLDGPIKTEYIQSTENIGVPDFLSELSSIDTTDLHLESFFVPRYTAEHTVEHPVFMQTCETGLLCPDHADNSNKNSNRQEATSVPSAVSFSLDDFTAEPSLPKHPILNTEQLSQPLPLLDLLPLASSTPDVAVGTNTQPFPFPMMPFTPANVSPTTVLAAVPLPPTQLIPHAPFTLETHQVPKPNSPHPVKPLTPPDEKRSEGRSVLEKLKSTIHPGRSHHGDQESEKKALVEGGGSYYHLNHSELVSLLLQRDAELQKEKEEYERRGVLLERREVEIKKMKALIRDLEDYIDTLLVRIMEQTPTLLQVRSKMK